MAHYSELKTCLEARRQALLERAGRTETDLRKERERDWTEQATQLENDAVLDRLDALSRAEISEVDRTLYRLNDGSYGR